VTAYSKFNPVVWYMKKCKIVISAQAPHYLAEVASPAWGKWSIYMAPSLWYSIIFTTKSLEDILLMLKKNRMQRTQALTSRPGTVSRRALAQLQNFVRGRNSSKFYEITIFGFVFDFVCIFQKCSPRRDGNITPPHVENSKMLGFDRFTMDSIISTFELDTRNTPDAFKHVPDLF